jgi:hypothetical protein
MSRRNSYLRRAAASSLAIAATGFLAAQSGAHAPSPAHATAQTTGGLPQTETLQAAEKVAANWARNAHVGGEIEMSIAQTTFAGAQAVIQSKAPDEAETGGATTIAQLRAEPVYLIVLTARDGAQFTPPESVPPGAEGPDLVVAVNTSEIVGEALWVAPPSLSQLGAVTETVIPTTATAAGPPLGSVTTVEGSVYKGARTVTGWHVLVGKPHANLLKDATRTSRTYVKGFYSFRLSPGSYELGVKTRNGRICATRSITVRGTGELKVTLKCP